MGMVLVTADWWGTKGIWEISFTQDTHMYRCWLGLATKLDMMYIHVYVYTSYAAQATCIGVYTYMYVYMYVYILYVCMYVYIIICIMYVYDVYTCIESRRAGMIEMVAQSEVFLQYSWNLMMKLAPWQLLLCHMCMMCWTSLVSRISPT